MNYQQLSSALQAVVENTFPSTETWDGGEYTPKEQIDMLIMQAEQRIFNLVRFPALRKNVTGVLEIGRPYLALPGDFLAVHSLALVRPSGAYEFLLNKDVSFLRSVYPNPATQAEPRFYAVFGPTTTSSAPIGLTDELSAFLAPTPDQTYPVELHYFFYPPTITTANTSWLGDNMDSLLLSAAVLEAAIFMKVDEKQFAVYNSRYAEALASAQQYSRSSERSDGFRT